MLTLKEQGKRWYYKMQITLPDSRFLSVEDYEVGDKVQCTIKDAGKSEEGKYGTVYVFTLEIMGEEKTFTFSGKNLRRLVELFGTDSNKFKDKVITLMVIPSTESKKGKKFMLI